MIIFSVSMALINLDYLIEVESGNICLFWLVHFTWHNIIKAHLRCSIWQNSFLRLKNIPLCPCVCNRYILYIIFICLPTNEHLDCFHISPTGNNAAMTIDVHTIYSRSCFQFFMEIYSWVVLLDHTAVLIFWGNSILFSMNVATFYISNNSV